MRVSLANQRAKVIKSNAIQDCFLHSVENCCIKNCKISVRVSAFLFIGRCRVEIMVSKSK